MKKVLTGTQKPGKMISLSANTKRNSMTYRKRMVTESFIEISGRGECHQYSLEEWEIIKMILAIIPIENNSLNKLKIVRGIKELFTLSLTQAIILVESASYYYVDFVNVNFRKDLNCLVADSNTWYTYFPVHRVEKEVGPGKWTKQITLGN